MKIRLNVLLVFVLTAFLFQGPLQSQQIPVLDEYRINPGVIAPSFTGLKSVFQVFLTQRNEWTGIPGSPVTGAVNIEGTPYRNMGLGTNITLNKSGIYRFFSVNLDYAYHLQVALDHAIHFGISPTLYQNSVDLTGLVIADQNDPMLSSGKHTETYVNCGFSLMYSYKSLNICLGMPYLFNNRSLYKDTKYSNYLTMGTSFQAYANYLLALGKDWGLQFDLLYRTAQESPWLIDAGAMIRYQELLWAGLMYRKGNILVVNAGVDIYNSFIVAYNYEFGFTAMNGKSGGTHEITLGYTLKGKQKKKGTPMKIKDY